MSGRGPQSMRGANPPTNVLNQDRKLHQLDVPVRTGLDRIIGGGDGVSGSPTGGFGGSASSGSIGPGASSWDDREVARQIAMLTEERDFLRKYVSRCEHELKAYQLQYPDLVGGHTAGAGGNGDLLNELAGSVEELPPWIGQAKYMSPLLVAYEARIEELMEKNQEQLHDFATLKQQYDDLYARNAEAEAELESNIKNLLHHMDQQKGAQGGVGGAGKGPVGKVGPLDEDEVEELQDQVTLYKEQNDILQSQKLELEQSLQQAQKHVGDARAERDAFWTQEVKKLQAALAQLRMERDKFKNSSSTLTQSQIDLSTLQKEFSALQKKFLQTQVALEQAEKENDTLIEKEKMATANLVNAERDLESLLKTLQSMEQQAQEARQREVQQVKKEGDFLQQKEQAKLEKDQALLREQSLRQDLQRMEQRAADDLAQAHRKHDDDLAAMYQRAKEQEQTLNQEITNMGLLLTEAEVARDKSLREIKDVKQASEKILAGIANELSTLKSDLGRKQSQIVELEAQKEDGVNKLKRAQAELSNATEFFTKEKNLAQELISSLKLKNESLTAQNQTFMQQQQRLTDGIAKLEKDLQECKRVADNSIARLTSQLHDLELSHKSQIDEYKQRLEEAYRLHERAEARAQELLQAQDLLAEKWRDENTAVRTQLSTLLKAEKSTVAELEKRVAEFEARTAQLVRERDQAMEFQAQYEQLKKSHELSTAELTQRIQSLTADLSSYAAREPEYLHTAKLLQQKLDRAEIEVKRWTRQYEAARKKAEFLETQLAHGGGLPTHQMPLQPATNIMNQAAGTATTGRSSQLQPIPFSQSLLPPSFTKKL